MLTVQIRICRLAWASAKVMERKSGMQYGSMVMAKGVSAPHQGPHTHCRELGNVTVAVGAGVEKSWTTCIQITGKSQFPHP